MSRHKTWEMLNGRWSHPSTSKARQRAWSARALWGDLCGSGGEFPAQQATPLHAPVFVVGHYRSGTTALQKLTSDLPGFATLTYFGALFPESFRRRQQRWQRPAQALTKALKLYDPIHKQPLDWSYPAEDDVALTMSFRASTPAWSHVFMARARDIQDDAERETTQTLWRNDFLTYVSRLQRAHGDQRLVLKSPPHLLRVAWLHETFQTARFLWIHRDRESVLRSQEQLWTTMQNTAVQQLPERQRQQCCHDQYDWLEAHGRQQRALVPDNYILDIEQTELKRDRSAVQQRITSWLTPGGAL